MYPLFSFIYVMVFIIAALIICLFQEVRCVLIQLYIFNIVWRYTYSIRLFLIEAKHRYRGKNIHRKHTLKNIASSKVTLYIRLFPSASRQSSSHWIRSSAINERNVCTSSTDNDAVYFVVDAKMCVCLNRSCVRSFAGCADLNLAGRAIEKGLGVASSVTQ